MGENNRDFFRISLQTLSNYFFLVTGVLFGISSVAIMLMAFWRVVSCFIHQCDILLSLIDFVGFLIISVAIFDVGRYLMEEEVFRDRELRSPREARLSLTKFMVIIVIAVTLEALLNVIRAGTGDFTLLIFPALLFLVAIFLLIALGLFQYFSVKAEVLVDENRQRHQIGLK